MPQKCANGKDASDNFPASARFCGLKAALRYASSLWISSPCTSVSR